MQNCRVFEVKHKKHLVYVLDTYYNESISLNQVLNEDIKDTVVKELTKKGFEIIGFSNGIDKRYIMTNDFIKKITE